MAPASQLSQYSTCELSDALIKLGVPHGGLIPDIHLMSPAGDIERSICGPAYIVRMVPAFDVSAPKLAEHFVDAAPAGSFIVIDAPPHVKNAVWGGLMSAGALARSVVGVVISGRCRDLAEHHRLGFAVFARGHSTLGQSSFTRPSEVNVPLLIHPQYQGAVSEGEFPPTAVEPGDWIIGDGDGVICVPRNLESKVVEIAARGRAVDELCMADIKAGRGVQASFEAHRGK